jgi:hypothetical protein
LSLGKRGSDSRILGRHCGAQAFRDYACGCQICCAAINENELFSSGLSFQAVSCRVLLKQHFAQDLEEMKGQYIWSVRYRRLTGLGEAEQLPGRFISAAHGADEWGWRWLEFAQDLR